MPRATHSDQTSTRSDQVPTRSDQTPTSSDQTSTSAVPAVSDNAGDSAPLIPFCPQNRAVSEDPLWRGPVCRFELVSGTGDAEVSRLAELQHGHVHLEQLRAAGIGRNALAARVRSGRLHRTLPGVYLVGRPQRDVRGRMMAAVLHLKGDGLVAGLAAAQLWGLLDTTQQIGDRDPIEVLLLGRNAAQPLGVRIHRVAVLARRDIRRRRGIPVTSPARTLLDLAGTLDDLELEAALSAAFRERLVRRSQLEDVIERNPRARGVGVLRALLAPSHSLRDTRSVYERRLLQLLRAAELPLPIVNVPLEGRVVDAFWPELKLVLEFDGWAYHRDKFESDRLRDQRMMVGGHRVIRVTRRQIDHRPYALVARIASLIAMLRLAGQPGAG